MLEPTTYRMDLGMNTEGKFLKPYQFNMTIATTYCPLNSVAWTYSGNTSSDFAKQHKTQVTKALHRVTTHNTRNNITSQVCISAIQAFSFVKVSRGITLKNEKKDRCLQGEIQNSVIKSTNFKAMITLQITYMVDSNIFYSRLAEISFQSNNVLSNGKKVNSSSFHLSVPAALVNTRSILVKVCSWHRSSHSHV